jgi:hypothetical protein
MNHKTSGFRRCIGPPSTAGEGHEACLYNLQLSNPSATSLSFKENQVDKRWNDGRIGLIEQSVLRAELRFQSFQVNSGLTGRRAAAGSHNDD